MAGNPDWALTFYWKIACKEPRSRCQPQKCEEDDGYAGNQEDRGREQLDQVSPLDIDSFFPFVCVWVRKESVSTVSVLEDLGQTLQCRAGGTPARLGDSRCAILSFERCATWLKKKNCFWETLPRCLKKNGCHRGCMEVYLGNLALPSAHFLRTRRNLLESVNLTGEEPACQRFGSFSHCVLGSRFSLMIKRGNRCDKMLPTNVRTQPCAEPELRPSRGWLNEVTFEIQMSKSSTAITQKAKTCNAEWDFCSTEAKVSLVRASASEGRDTTGWQEKLKRFKGFTQIWSLVNIFDDGSEPSEPINRPGPIVLRV